MNDVLELSVLSLRDPRAAARRVIGFSLSQRDAWLAAAAVAALSALVSSVVALTVDISTLGSDLVGEQIVEPFFRLAISVVVLLTSILAGHSVARAFNGTGSLVDTTMIMVWIQFVNIAIQAVLLPAGWVAPQLWFGLIALISLYMVWVTAQFLREAHGFNSVGPGIGIVVVISLLTIYVTGLLG